MNHGELKHAQFIVVRSDVAFSQGFLGSQIGHAVAGSFYPFLLSENEITPGILSRLHIDNINDYYVARSHVRQWLASSFFKKVVKLKLPSDLLYLGKQLEYLKIPFVLIKESSPVKVGIVTETVHEKSGTMYLTNRYPYFSPFTDQNCHIKNGCIYLNPTDDEGTLTCMGVSPQPAVSIPSCLRHLPLLD